MDEGIRSKSGAIPVAVGSKKLKHSIATALWVGRRLEGTSQKTCLVCLFYTKLRVRAFIGGFMFGKNFISSLVLLWAFVLVPCGLKAQENDTLHYALEEVVALSASGVTPASAAVPFSLAGN